MLYFSVVVIVTTNGIWVDRSVAGSQITLQPHSLPEKACKILDLQCNSMSCILLVLYINYLLYLQLIHYIIWVSVGGNMVNSTAHQG